MFRAAARRGFTGALCAVALFTLAAHAAKKPRTGEIEWQPDLAAALAAATASGRPVVADFFTTWCAPCRQLEKTVFKDPRVVEFSKDYVWVRIDADKDTVSARRYRIQMYPTIVVMKPDGAEHDRLTGVPTVEQFKTGIADYCAGRNTLVARLAEEPERGGDPEFLLDLAGRLIGHGRHEEAVQRARRVFEATNADTSKHAPLAGFLMLQSYEALKKPWLAAAAGQRWVERYRSHPLRPAVLVSLAGVYLSVQDRPHARQMLQAFVDENPTDPRVPQMRMAISGME
jgi:thiol-disulfide isomerase/thioredoxin